MLGVQGTSGVKDQSNSVVEVSVVEANSDISLMLPRYLWNETHWPELCVGEEDSDELSEAFLAGNSKRGSAYRSHGQISSTAFSSEISSLLNPKIDPS